MRTSDCWMVADFHLCSEQFRTVFIPISNTVKLPGTNCETSRCPTAPHIVCNCECEVHTTAICHGHQQCAITCIHPSTRQKTDKIFEIDMSALAQCTCMPRDSGSFLTHYACAYPSVTHGWIFLAFQSFCSLFSRCSTTAAPLLSNTQDRPLCYGTGRFAGMPGESFHDGIRFHLQVAA